MTSIILVGVAGALVLLAIVVKTCFGKSKKADKWEKAEIVKRLVALSDRENAANGLPRQKPVLRTPAARRRAAAGRGA